MKLLSLLCVIALGACSYFVLLSGAAHVDIHSHLVGDIYPVDKSSNYSVPTWFVSDALPLQNKGTPHYACTPSSVNAYMALLNSTLGKYQRAHPVAKVGQCNCFHIVHLRQDSAFVICLPTVFISGVAKSGTSSLYSYLVEDPRFAEGASKEVWHTFVPFADEFNRNFTSERRRQRMERYVKYFSFKGKVACGASVSDRPGVPAAYDRLRRHSKGRFSVDAGEDAADRCVLAYTRSPDAKGMRSLLNSLVAKGFIDEGLPLPPAFIEKWARDNMTEAVIEMNNVRALQKTPVHQPLEAAAAANSDRSWEAGGTLRVNEKVLMTVDATPDYHFYADVPGRIHAAFPTSRSVLLVRDTLERVWSTYQYCNPDGRSADAWYQMYNFSAFVDTVRQHQAQMQTCIDHSRARRSQQASGAPADPLVLADTNVHWAYHFGRRDRDSWVPHSSGHPTHRAYEELYAALEEAGVEPCHLQPFSGHHNQLIGRGEVFSHLQWWAHHFSPKQLLVVDYRMFTRRPRETVDAVLRFLELPPGDSNVIPDYVFGLKHVGPLTSKPVNTTSSTGSAPGADFWAGVEGVMEREMRDIMEGGAVGHIRPSMLKKTLNFHDLMRGCINAWKREGHAKMVSEELAEMDIQKRVLERVFRNRHHAFTLANEVELLNYDKGFDAATVTAADLRALATILARYPHEDQIRKAASLGVHVLAEFMMAKP